MKTILTLTALMLVLAMAAPAGAGLPAQAQRIWAPDGDLISLDQNHATATLLINDDHAGWLDEIEAAGGLQQRAGDGALPRADFQQGIGFFRPNSIDDLVNNHRVMQKVLPKPFPGTVTQGVILVLVIINNQLKVLAWNLSKQTTRLES